MGQRTRPTSLPLSPQDRAILAELPEAEDRELVLRCMADAPGLSAAKAVEMLRDAGGL